MNGRPNRFVGRQPLVVVFAALNCGAALDRHGVACGVFWCLLGLLALAGWSVGYQLRALRISQGLLAIAILALGGAAHDASWRIFSYDEIGRFAGGEGLLVCVEARVVHAPRHIPEPPYDPLRSLPQGARSQIRIRLLSIRDQGTWRGLAGESILVVDGRLEGIEAGDRVRVSADLQGIALPRNPGEVSFAAHERVSRRLCRLYAPSPQNIVRVAAGSRWNPRRMLDRLRRIGETSLDHFVGDQAGLASAILLGSRENIPADELDTYLATGTMHLLAISGMNVGILAFGFWFAARFGILSRKLTLTAVGVLVLVYALLTGFEPPVMRAALFVMAACCGKWLGRQGNGFNTLSAAGICVFLLNPASVFQVGTQLSFLAVGMLQFLDAWHDDSRPQDPLEQLIESTRPATLRWLQHLARGARTALTASIWVWAATTPLVWYRFQIISPVGLLLNPLVWLPIVIAMYSGFGVMVVTWVIPWLGGRLGWLCQFSLHMMREMVDGSLGLPGSHFWLPSPSAWWVAVFYLALGIWLVMRPSGNRVWRPLAFAVIWTSGAIWLSPVAGRWNPSDHVTCSFLAVGHGGCVVVELPDGRVLLYDAGRMGAPSRASQSATAFLFHRGIRHLDAVVVSHADTDHFNALPDLMRRVSIGVIYVAPAMALQRSPAVDLLRTAAQNRCIPIRTLSAPDSLEIGHTVVAKVLHPTWNPASGSDNSQSLVVSLVYRGRRILLTGDLESPGLDRLLALPPERHEIVLAPHHGSPRSAPAALSHWAQPNWVIISDDRPSRTVTTSTVYSQRHANVLHTATVGAIRFQISASGELRLWLGADESPFDRH